MAILLALILGLIAGLLCKSININITHKHEQPKQQREEVKYNESLVGMLPPEVQNYYKETQGQNRF